MPALLQAFLDQIKGRAKTLSMRVDLHGRDDCKAAYRPLLATRLLQCGNTTTLMFMTKEQVKEILQRVLTWPPERQEDAARVLADMEEQDASLYHLSNEQVEEVRRRRQDFREGQERYATDEEIAALWKKCGL
jgi:hypothetical protein